MKKCLISLSCSLSLPLSSKYSLATNGKKYTLPKKKIPLVFSVQNFSPNIWLLALNLSEIYKVLETLKRAPALLTVLMPEHL